MALLSAVSVNAQEGLISYRLHFNISETGQDGKTATRHYGVLAGNKSRAKVNSTRRIPHLLLRRNTRTTEPVAAQISTCSSARGAAAPRPCALEPERERQA